MTPASIAAVLDAAFSQARPSCANEAALQRAIGVVLTTANVSHVREARLTPRDRPDFLVVAPADEWRTDAPGIAIEVKVKGSLSDLTRQVFRYAEIERVTGVLVVTTKNLHRGIPDEVLGKAVTTLVLADLFL